MSPHLLLLVASDEEKTDLLLIYDVQWRTDEEAEPSPLRYLLDWDRRGRVALDWEASRFSQFSLFFERLLPLLPRRFFSLTTARLILPSSEWQRSKSTIADLLRAVTFKISTVTARYNPVSSDTGLDQRYRLLPGGIIRCWNPWSKAMTTKHTYVFSPDREWKCNGRLRKNVQE